MRITSLIENTSLCGFPTEHGLSLYIELNDGTRVLFDMGQGTLFAQNALRLGLNIADVDVAIVSHGHYDHGGGLEHFLTLNTKAKVFIHEQAFESHYSLRENGLHFIGINPELKANKRITLCSGTVDLGHGLTLFSGVNGTCCLPKGNRLLYGAARTHDRFEHEQNLIVKEGESMVLVAGCAHCGIVNILDHAEQMLHMRPTYLLAGMHLVKSGLSEEEENAFIGELSQHLLKRKWCQFHTMHCTGTDQFSKLKCIMGKQINYLSCGESITIQSK
ncbi:MAG: MBL fold metallo-hydrolase [Muribaculaceae bacterium]|nr:MBL fold metallo-hydrolase [Muribaculaceae bacterium]